MNKINNINDLVEFCRPFQPVSHETAEALKTYAVALEKWQKKINLVSQATIPDLWHRHFADSAQLAKFIKPQSSLIDIGSGAGFPALVLAILGCHVTVVESDQRKCAFMAEIARLTNVEIQIENKRIEDVQPKPYNFITARALASLDKLLEYAIPYIDLGANAVFLKGGDVAEELTLAKEIWHIDYQVNRSLTDPDGSILLIEEVKRG